MQREDLIDDIREFSKAETGSRNTYGDIDKLAELDLEELETYFRDLTGAQTMKTAQTTSDSDNDPGETPDRKMSDEEYNKRHQDMAQALQWSDRDDPHR